MKKRFVAVVLGVFLVLNMSIPTLAIQKNYTIAEIQGKYKTQGRTAVVEDTLMFYWSGSGITFNAECSGTVEITTVTDRLYTKDQYGIFFTVFVDGVMQGEDLRIPQKNSPEDWIYNSTNYPFHITQKGESVFKIATNLNSGVHTFEIYMQTEAANGSFGIKSIGLNGSFTDPPVQKDLYFEIVGDSIAASYSNIAAGKDNAAPLYQDATRGWPLLTAKKMNADWSIIARSGITATKGIGYSGESSISMPDVYPTLRYYDDNETEYNFVREPDVILVSLGTNDINTYSKTEGATLETVAQGFSDFLGLLREKNPNAKIVWLYGMMTTGANKLINDAIFSAGGYKKGYYSLELPLSSSGHPELEYQYDYAEIISEYICDVVFNPNYVEIIDTGLRKGDTIIYRATDAVDNKKITVAQDGTQTATPAPYVSGDDTAWKYEVSGFNDFFYPSTVGFDSPEVEPFLGGRIKISWENPQNAKGQTVVKILGNNYNKELLVSSNSIIIDDVNLGDTYQIQIVCENCFSSVLTYRHLYAPTYITDNTKKIKTKVSSNAQRKYDRMYVNLEDYAEYVNENSGVLIKVETEEQTDNDVISYYDAHTGVKKTVLCSSENSQMQEIDMYSGDVGLSFQTMLYVPEIDKNNNYTPGALANVDSTATNLSKWFDINGGTLVNGTHNTSLITNGDHMMSQNFKAGYIFIPFDVISDTDLSVIKEVGAINLVVQRHKYYAKNYFDNDNTWKWHALEWSETDFESTATGNIDYWFDREVHFSQALFIADYETFIQNSFDENNLTGGINYDCFSSDSLSTGSVYMEPTENGSDYILTNSSVSSNYLIDDSDNYINKIIYTTASGEKMHLGFTAVHSGLYEVSSKINVPTDVIVKYRVVKESTNGVVTILQDEKIYNGDKYFTLMNTNLKTGETIYFEAWSDRDGVKIDIGVPQIVFLGNSVNGDIIKYSANEYIGIDSMNDFGAVGSWEYGTFINPFIADGTKYEYLYKTAYNEASEIKHDVLGIKAMSEIDDLKTEIDETDATALFNAFRPYDGIATYNSTSNTLMYQAKENGLANSSQTMGGYRIWTPLRYSCLGQLIVNKTNTKVTIQYGFGLAAGGSAVPSTRTVNINFGHYQQFNVPANGRLTLDLGMADNPGKIIVLHNKKVIAAYSGGSLLDVEEDISLDVLSGDVISIAHGTIDDADKGLSIEAAGEVSISPVVYFTPKTEERSSVTFDCKIPTPMKMYQQNGTVITLPTTSKAGAIFKGWVDDYGVVYASNQDYLVNGDVDFAAVFIYYGDLNGSGADINAVDLSLMRKILLGCKDVQLSNDVNIVADLNVSNQIDIIDFIKLKKLVSGASVTIGV